MDISPALAAPLQGRDLAADEQLAIEARDDPSAFGLLYQRHVERVFRFLRARGASEELAADLTEWWDGGYFPADDMRDIFAVAASEGSAVTFVDFDDYSRDIYRYVFDGVGGWRRVSLVSDGVPVGPSAS
jgi:hypothetical protein